MTVSITELYDILTEKMGKEQAYNIVKALEVKAQSKLLAERSSSVLQHNKNMSSIKQKEIFWRMWALILYAVIMLLLAGLYFK